MDFCEDKVEKGIFQKPFLHSDCPENGTVQQLPKADFGQ